MDINVAGLNKVTCISDSSHNGRTVTISDGTHTWSGTIANITDVGYACIFMIPSMPAPAKKPYRVSLKDSYGSTEEYGIDIELGFGDSIIVGLDEGMEAADKDYVDDQITTRAYVLPTAGSSTKGGVKVTSGTGNGVYMDGEQLKTALASSSQFGAMKTGTGLTPSNGVVSLNTATENSLGGIKIGNGLSISNGYASIKRAYYGSSNKGGVYLSDSSNGYGLFLDTDGELRVVTSTGLSKTSAGIKLNAATSSSLGGVKIGNGINDDGNGEIFLTPQITYSTAATQSSYSIDGGDAEKITLRSYNSTVIERFYTKNVAIPLWAKIGDNDNARDCGFIMRVNSYSSYIEFIVNYVNAGNDVVISNGANFRVYYVLFL